MCHFSMRIMRSAINVNGSSPTWQAACARPSHQASLTVSLSCKSGAQITDGLPSSQHEENGSSLRHSNALRPPNRFNGSHHTATQASQQLKHTAVAANHVPNSLQQCKVKYSGTRWHVLKNPEHKIQQPQRNVSAGASGARITRIKLEGPSQPTSLLIKTC